MHPLDGSSLFKLLRAYLFLLIFEGAARKWIPGMAAPLLLIRDPLALLIWISAFKNNVIPKSIRSWFGIYAVALTGYGIFQLLVVQLNFYIFLYGLRSYILHVPVCLAIGYAYAEEDLQRTARSLMLIGCGMTVLMVMQYLAPVSSFLNRGAGEGANQIAGALGHIRASGTFSFIAGPILFFPLLMAFIFWSWYERRQNPLLILLAFAATAIAMPISISRSLVLGCGLVVVAGIVALPVAGGLAVSSRNVFRILMTLITLISLLVLAGRIRVVSESLTAFSYRWEQAKGREGDNSALIARIEKSFTGGFEVGAQQPPFGFGIGIGSQVAAILQNIGALQFGESPPEREVAELGATVGSVFLALRFSLAIWLIFASLRSLMTGSVLAWVLMPGAASLIGFGALDQPTGQGFAAVVGGLAIAAIRVHSFHSSSTEEANDGDHRPRPGVV